MARQGTRTRTTTNSRSSSGKSGFIRGEAGMGMIDKEIAKEKDRKKQQGNRKPFRMWIPPGETRTVAILDEKPDFFLYEHHLKDPANDMKWTKFLPCCKLEDNCPVCETTGVESYYAMVLSILDFTEYKNKKGETVEWSRKLMIVKPSQQKKFIRMYKKNETLRGAVIELTRDGDKDPGIGNDIELIEFMDDSEFGNYVSEWTDKDKKLHTEDCSVPFDYEKIFDMPDKEKLRVEIGAPPSTGSKKEEEKLRQEEKEEEEEWEDPEEEEWEEEEGEEEEGEVIEGEIVDGEEEEEEEVKPKRASRRPSSPAAKKKVTSKKRRTRR